MKLRIFSPPALACALVAGVLAALTLGPFMRETDQAWLLDGGLAIANGHPEIARAEFNFDKQFVSYYLPGLMCRFLPRPFTGDTLVLAGNILGMLLFWGGLFWLLARSSRRLPLALVWPVILVPSFLVYSSFYASAFASAAFVIFLAIFLAREKWSWPLHLISFALAFGAVGARADAIFLLPLLAMLHSPRRTFVSVLRSPNTWLMATGGLTAFFLGRALYLDDLIDYAPSSFRLKPYLGFVAFGLGGAAVLLLAALHAVWSARSASRCRLWLVFLWLGLALPMGYYSLQLLSPRHCTVGAVSVLIFVCAKRGRAIFQNYFQPKLFALTVKTILLLSALGPVFLGLNLTDLQHPKITATQPTWIPSGAGGAPAGAYLAFAWDVRRSHGFLDHNHAVWAAADRTRFEAGADGKVPYLFSPIESYTKFAIRLQGKIPDRYSLTIPPYPPHVYLESRSLLRFQFTFPPQKVSLENFFATTVLVPVSDSRWHGLTMYRGDLNSTGLPGALNGPLWALNTVFGLEEFRLEPSAALAAMPADWAGKKLVLVSREKFGVTTKRELKTSTLTSPALGEWHICEISPLRAGDSLRLEPASAAEVFVGIGAFPEWMSLQKL